MRIFKPIYKKNCNWCKFLMFGLASNEAECRKTGGKFSFEDSFLNNKACKEFKCCDSCRTLLDKVKDFIGKFIKKNKTSKIFIKQFFCKHKECTCRRCNNCGKKINYK